MAVHPDTGLWPLLLTGLYSDPNRPWHTGELEPVALPGTDAASADRVLARLWNSAFGGTPEDFDWGGRRAVSGRAVARPGGRPDACRRPGRRGRRAGTGARRRRRPDDRAGPGRPGGAALAACGWLGAVNHASVADIAVIVGSWEERFGARLVGVGFDTLDLSVAAPPTTPPAALSVAAEHYAFCPDNIGGAEQLDEYAAALVGCRHWGFWWD